LAISAAFFELLTGCESSCVLGSSSFAQAGVKLRQYAQPDWTDDAGVSNRVQKLGFKSGTLAAGASATIDLTALDSPDGGSGTISLSTLVACYIQITSTTGLLTIGNAAADAHQLDFGGDTHTRTIRPSSPGHAVGDYAGTGYTVDATNKNVKVLNSHGSASVDYVAYFAGR
jgi:hypothetical protein